MGLFAWLMIIAICSSVDADTEDDQKPIKGLCYKLNEMTEMGKQQSKLTEDDKEPCKENQCFRMKYWTEKATTGKKLENYPGYFGGCRDDLPGKGGPWEFPNDCKDYTVSRTHLDAFLGGDGEKLKESVRLGKLKVGHFKNWTDTLNITSKEMSEEDDDKFKYDYKVELCYCKNEKDGTPCNGKAEDGTWKTIGVSKSGVATLALTIVLLGISIIGVWFFVKSCQVPSKEFGENQGKHQN